MKLKFLSTLCALSLTLTCVLPISAQAATTYTHEDVVMATVPHGFTLYPLSDGYWSCYAANVKTQITNHFYMDIYGNTYLWDVYSAVGQFHEGFAKVTTIFEDKTGLIQYIDLDFNVVYTLSTTDGRGTNFSEGLAAICEDIYTQPWRLVDTNFNTVAWLDKSIVGNDVSFQEGLTAVRVEDNTDYEMGFIDRTGKLVIPVEYYRTTNFSEGLAAVKKQWDTSSCGYIDKTGAVAIPLTYADAEPFSEGLAAVGQAGVVPYRADKYGFIDKTGNQVIPFIYDEVGSFHDGCAKVGTDTDDDGDADLFGFIDQNGNEVAPMIYAEVEDFSDGLAMVSLDGKTDGYMDTSGTVIIPMIYSSGRSFSEGYATALYQGTNYILRNPIVETTETTTETTTTSSTGFTDVAIDSYYEDAVAWAVANGVTTGYSDGTFRPTDTCTRGQVVTFLWRAMGEPTPSITENPFSDVSESSAFYTAILWAVGEGITTGYSDGTFHPSSTCTTGQVLTFLYRAVGEPDTTYESTYADGANAAFVDAINWADGSSLLDSLTITVAGASPRSDIVTYLYRNADSPAV